MKSIRQVLGQLTTVLTIEMAYLGNSIVESLNINIPTGKAGLGGKDSPAWEPDAITKVHIDTSKGSLSVPILMNFWKSFKRPLTNTPFSENHVAIFFKYHPHKALFKGPKSEK